MAGKFTSALIIQKTKSCPNTEKTMLSIVSSVSEIWVFRFSLLLQINEMGNPIQIGRNPRMLTNGGGLNICSSYQLFSIVFIIRDIGHTRFEEAKIQFKNNFLFFLNLLLFWLM